MSRREIRVHLKVPMNPLIVRESLEEAGFEIEELMEVRGGIFDAVDVVSFVIDHLDDAVISVLAGVVANMISKGRMRERLGERGVRFSVKDSQRSVIVNVTGDGNWVQVHPPPPPPDEEPSDEVD